VEHAPVLDGGQDRPALAGRHAGACSSPPPSRILDAQLLADIVAQATYRRGLQRGARRAAKSVKGFGRSSRGGQGSFTGSHGRGPTGGDGLCQGLKQVSLELGRKVGRRRSRRRRSGDGRGAIQCGQPGQQRSGVQCAEPRPCSPPPDRTSSSTRWAPGWSR
jgi:hypothetical protein